MNETTLLQTPRVVVTSHRVQTASRTVPMHQIASVSVERRAVIPVSLAAALCALAVPAVWWLGIPPISERGGAAIVTAWAIVGAVHAVWATRKVVVAAGGERVEVERGKDALRVAEAIRSALMHRAP